MNRLLNSIRYRYLTAKRKFSHGDLIERLIFERKLLFPANPVFVETGCGVSTASLNKYAKELNATVYSLDYNSEKSNDLKLRVGGQVENVQFLIGDSLESLPKIIAKHNIDFLFLDSAASAMHTFREFQICEPVLKPGAGLLIDNAALPCSKGLLSPVRKGKILVPYLLASPYWEVKAHPRAGDSMVSALLHKEANFADPEFEHQEYIDNWKARFNKAIK